MFDFLHGINLGHGVNIFLALIAGATAALAKVRHYTATHPAQVIAAEAVANAVSPTGAKILETLLNQTPPTDEGPAIRQAVHSGVPVQVATALLRQVVASSVGPVSPTTAQAGEDTTRTGPTWQAGDGPEIPINLRDSANDTRTTGTTFPGVPANTPPPGAGSADSAGAIPADPLSSTTPGAQ